MQMLQIPEMFAFLISVVVDRYITDWLIKAEKAYFYQTYSTSMNKKEAKRRKLMKALVHALRSRNPIDLRSLIFFRDEWK